MLRTRNTARARGGAGPGRGSTQVSAHTQRSATTRPGLDAYKNSLRKKPLTQRLTTFINETFDSDAANPELQKVQNIESQVSRLEIALADAERHRDELHASLRSRVQQSGTGYLSTIAGRKQQAEFLRAKNKVVGLERKWRDLDSLVDTIDSATFNREYEDSLVTATAVAKSIGVRDGLDKAEIVDDAADVLENRADSESVYMDEDLLSRVYSNGEVEMDDDPDLAELRGDMQSLDTEPRANADRYTNANADRNPQTVDSGRDIYDSLESLPPAPTHNRRRPIHASEDPFANLF